MDTYTCDTCHRDVDADEIHVGEVSECDDCLDARMREARGYFREWQHEMNVQLHDAAGEALRNWADDVRTRAKDHA